jgi:hypothetical protein
VIESFLYGTWIGGQVLYWFFLKQQTALLGEEYWQMLNRLIYPGVRSEYCHPGSRCAIQLAEFETHCK